MTKAEAIKSIALDTNEAIALAIYFSVIKISDPQRIKEIWDVAGDFKSACIETAQLIQEVI